jgi:mRNA interferase RelE/StbE
LGRFAASLPLRMPRPNVKALKGGGFRLRVGDYRVLYALRDDLLVLLVVQIAHRREAYRGGSGKRG